MNKKEYGGKFILLIDPAYVSALAKKFLFESCHKIFLSKWEFVAQGMKGQ